MVGSVLVILTTASQAEVFPIQEVVMSVAGVAIGYMLSVAHEDAAMKGAIVIQPDAAPSHTHQGPSPATVLDVRDRKG